MRHAVAFIKLHFYPILLILLACIVFTTNYIPGTYLAGWDNLQTDLWPKLGITRAFFGVWQEYQSMGLLSGLAHASDLLRAVCIFMLSFVLSGPLIRYVFHISMLLLGGIGIYQLLEEFGLHSEKRYAAFVGAVFYMLNFGTVQIFSLPWESFSIFFAFLPWLLWSSYRVLNAKHATLRHDIFIFLILAILATPMSYVQTIFLVFMAVLCLFCLGIWLAHRSGSVVSRTLFIILSLACINAFWLLPQIYALKSVSSITQQSSINMLSTEDTFSKNLVKGTIPSFIKLEGFYFDTTNSKLQFTFAPWKKYQSYPPMIILPYLFALIALIGFFTLKQYRWAILCIWILVALSLLSATPPFSWINEALRQQPFINQLFRSPFTKFIIPHSLLYSVLIGFGLVPIVNFIHRYFIFSKRSVVIGFIAIILASSYPVFQGNFFSSTVKSPIPQEYFSLMDYLKHQSPNKRIALLPEPTIWGWYWDAYGYDGSGLLWYGIQQPVISRTFDTWSNVSENYYWELTRALYSKNANDLLSVFRKYNVSYVLLDENVLPATNWRSLFIDDSKQLIKSMPTKMTSQHFGKLTLYEIIDAPQSFVSMKQDIPSVFPPYRFTDNDVAYRDIGDYITNSERTNDQILYPFRSLFTKRSVNEREFSVSESDRSIDITSTSVATTASILKQNTEVYNANGTNILLPKNVIPCETNLDSTPLAQSEEENTQSFLRITSQNTKNCMSIRILNLPHKFSYLVAVESRHISGKPPLFSFINETAKHVEEEAFLPITPNWKTSYFILPPLASDGVGYTVYLSNDSIGKQNTVNDIRSIRIYKIPYETMVNMKIVTGNSKIASSSAATHNVIDVTHPNPALYTIETGDWRLETGKKTLVLAQSYDSGWIAYDPMKKQLLTHVLVNNWENGWELNNSTTIYVFFWPQLLEWIGFALLPVPFLFLFRRHRD